MLLFTLIAFALCSVPQADPPAEQAAPEETPQTAPAEGAKGKRVFLVVDRFREFGGELVSWDEEHITIRRDGRTETYEVNKLLGIIPLQDIPDGGADGIVYMRDGSSLDALILADDYEQVLVQIEGIEHELPRKQVLEVEIKPDFETFLKAIRQQIQPDNLEARIEIAQLMTQRGLLKRARAELVEVLTFDDHPKAKQLIDLLDAKIALQTSSTGAPLPLGPKNDRTVGLPKRQLTGDDVNIIRVFEIDFMRPPKVNVTKDTIDSLIAAYATHPAIPTATREREALHGLSEIEQVKLIFDAKAREFYSEITVESEPYSLSLFRMHVHNAWLIRNCATSACHGGQNAGKFYLHRADTNDPRTIYENLLILERLNLDGQHRLINYEDPEMSLIIQHALPASESRVPHPPVPGYDAVFPAGGGRMKRETIRWINAMYRPRPKYPLDFVPPSQIAPIQVVPAPRIDR